MTHFFFGGGEFKTRITFIEIETSVLRPLYEIFTETCFLPLKKIGEKIERKHKLTQKVFSGTTLKKVERVQEIIQNK